MPTSFPNLQQDLHAAVVQVVSYARKLAQWSVLLLPSDSLMYSIGGVVLFLALYHEYDPLQGIVSNTIPYSDLASATTLPPSLGFVSSTPGTQSCPTRTVTSPTSTQVVRLCLFHGGEVMLTQENSRYAVQQVDATRSQQQQSVDRYKAQLLVSFEIRLTNDLRGHTPTVHAHPLRPTRLTPSSHLKTGTPFRHSWPPSKLIAWRQHYRK